MRGSATATAAATATTSRKRLTADERRAQLLDAARAVIAAGGVASVTMDRIAAEAGVSKALVYLHFENTDEVLAAVLENELARLDHDAARRLAKATTFSERLEALGRP